MKIKFISECDIILKNKIGFVIQTFSEYIGSTVEDKDELVLLYSDKEKPDSYYDILIKSDPFAAEYFSTSHKFPSGHVHNYSYNDETFPVLFHNEAGELFDFDVENKKLILNVDILASSFFFLSLWQEYISEERDGHDRFCAKSSLQYELNILTKPVVTIYFNFLKSLITKYYSIGFTDSKSYLAMTHDIDYIRKWSPGIIYREMIQYFFLNRLGVSIKKRIERLKSFLKAYTKENDPYRYSFDKMIEFELENNVRSTCFIKAGATSKHDVSYSLRNKYLRKCIEKLKLNHFDIGLHPSYNAYNDEKMTSRELKRLKSAFGLDTPGVRQHFLRYDVKITPLIHSSLNFKYDATLSYHDHEGFRTGFSYPHKLFDIKNDIILNITEVPLIVMDSTLESYRKLSPGESLKVIKEMVNIIKKYGGVFTLLIHNTCYDELDYKGWGEVYENTIRYAKENNLPVSSVSDVLHSYYTPHRAEN